MAESGSATKRHNPVDSIRRKIKTIEMRDQESNPCLQIPKFQSRNFDSPQSSTKKDLEEVLKNQAMKNTSRDMSGLACPSMAASGLSPQILVQSPLMKQSPLCDSPLGSLLYSSNVPTRDKAKKVWPCSGSHSCSTPVILPRDSRFKFQHATLPGSEFKSIILEDHVTPSISSFYFEQKSENFTLKSPVVKRLSMSEGAGVKRMTEHKPEPTSDISLICEEDLLNSIFHACDTEHRGKVAVSKIVDYLRHTTSRGAEDSGLTELCNMLDPEKRDISMDLDTYHAIMREWVDDCRNNATENRTKDAVSTAEDSMIRLRDSIMAVRRLSGTTMNITSGSLEAFGGDISRDLDTSDLITCVADLQYNNQKLQEQHAKLKAAIETQEETNRHLLEENEELRTQWKSAQQSISKTHALKIELEEMKSNMSVLEESRAKLLAQNKMMEKETLSLIHQISSLQEENHRSAIEVDEVRKTLCDVSDKAAVLQLQLTEFENALQKRDASLLLKDLYVEELKSTVMEYSSVIENLRIEKSKLESNLQQMEQELLSNGINSPLTHKLNRVLSGGLNSLHTELEFAQQSAEVSAAEWTFPSGRTSTLDVTLDREVLLLLQGPGHEQLAAEFKAILQTLQEDTCAITDQVLVSLQQLIDSDIDVKDLSGKMLEVITADLKQKRVSWEQKLKQLDGHRESLDGEFIKLSGNVRRMKTELLHLKKELSSRAHDLEAARQQLEEAKDRESEISTQLQDSASEHQRLSAQVAELQNALVAVQSEAQTLRGKLEEAEREKRELSAVKSELLSRCQTSEEELRKHQETVDRLQESLLLYQKRSEAPEDAAGLSTVSVRPLAHGKEEKHHICERIGRQETDRRSGPHKTSVGCSAEASPLLDALSLEVGEHHSRARAQNRSTNANIREDCLNQDKALSDDAKSSADLLLTAVRASFVSLGVQTDVETSQYLAMDKAFSQEIRGHVSNSGTVDNTSSFVNSHPPPSNAFLDDTFVAPGTSPKSSGTTLKNLESKVSTEKVNVAESSGGASKDNIASSNPASSQQETEVCKDGGSPNPEKECYGDNKVPPAEAIGTSSLVELNLRCADDSHPPNKELESEFLRLSLGFKCDIFTLDKRLRLEERSRDLAEDNLKKELASCKKLLEALSPLCEEDNHMNEIVKRLEKSLQFLTQHTSRVASRAELLGAIHQESRVSKAVDVMIQHVENLKRMYAKEHAELEELREAMQQSDRSTCAVDREDTLKLASSACSKVSPARRVSMPAYTRAIATGSAMDIFGGDKMDKMHRRANSWKLVGSRQNDSRPTLQRVVDSCSRPEETEENVIKEDEPIAELVEEVMEERTRRFSLLQKIPSSAITQSKYHKVFTNMKNSILNINKPLVITLVAAFLFVTLAGFLTGLSLHRPVDGASAGSGISWTTVQQFLWPYTGLQHNAPPPV